MWWWFYSVEKSKSLCNKILTHLCMGVWVPTMARERSVNAILGAQSVHVQYSMIRCPNICVFGISTTNVVIWTYFGKDWRHFLKKIFFSPKGPPFGFRVICSPVFGLREGFIFKLESCGFHQTSSFCELNPHVNAKNQTPKFWFYHPPIY